MCRPTWSKAGISSALVWICHAVDWPMGSASFQIWIQDWVLLWSDVHVSDLAFELCQKQLNASGYLGLWSPFCLCLIAENTQRVEELFTCLKSSRASCHFEIPLWLVVPPRRVKPEWQQYVFRQKEWCLSGTQDWAVVQVGARGRKNFEKIYCSLLKALLCYGCSSSIFPTLRSGTKWIQSPTIFDSSVF